MARFNTLQKEFIESGLMKLISSSSIAARTVDLSNEENKKKHQMIEHKL